MQIRSIRDHADHEAVLRHIEALRAAEDSSDAGDRLDGLIEFRQLINALSPEF